MKNRSMIIALLWALPTLMLAQSWFTPEVEKRADALLKQMTVREKLIYIGGVDWMYTRAFPRLGITSAKMSDGPQGLGTWGQSTAYPCALMLASSWNQELAHSYGEALASDCKARGVNILLGPGVNIYRAPMCGRNFEYMGEDPYLTAQTAKGYIQGLQANGVMAVIKHFAANFQEYDRNFVSSDIDERTLHEIYFPAFLTAIKEAEVGAVMSSYNLLNGVWTTEDPWLLKEVLRKQWGFNGLLMSDWGSTHNCIPAVKNGLDLEMAGNEIENEEALRKYLASGEIAMSDIDLKVKHILQTLIGFGVFDKIQLDGSIPLNNPATVQTAKEVSEEGIVLLKNSANVLPLRSATTKKIAVVGNNALICPAGGGSGLVRPFSYTTYFDGLKKLGEEKGFEVTYVDRYDHMTNELYVSSASDERGLKGEYFNNKNMEGAPVATKTDARIGFEWTMGCEAPGVNKNDFSVRWTGELRCAETGDYEWVVSGDDGYRLFINEVKVFDEYAEGPFRERRHSMTLQQGERYSIRLEYFQAGGGAQIDFCRIKRGEENRFEQELNKADVVVAFIGHNSSSEGEASDRSFALPSVAENLILETLATAKPIVAVVNAGGNVDTRAWESGVDGLIWGWYGGQEAGTAMASVLLGDVNPSGKLPITFEEKWEDNPVFNSYYATDKRVKFTEGIFVGYRGYDKLKREVRYPFGFGLSYTTFAFSDLQIVTSDNDENLAQVSCTVRNTGKVGGAEVVQLYLNKQGGSPVERPLRELKSYSKVYLELGESKVVTMTLPKNAFAYYDVVTKAFVVDNGSYLVELATSSRDIKLSSLLSINYTPTGIDAKVEKKKNRLVPTVVRRGEPFRIEADVVNSITLCDLNGKQVARYENATEVTTEGLRPGVYLVCIQADGLSGTDRLVVY